MILGAIGDDFTGSSDLGLMLAKGGLKTTQYVGVPSAPASADVEAGIISLKTRSTPAADAVEQSLAALKWLRAQGCRVFYFKYCSTFDSTPRGNIGPVIDALIDALACRDPVLVCPTFPATGRTVYQGHLFVHDRLLNESGMESHPLTPMTDPDIRRWLGLQTRRPVGHLPLAELRAGDARRRLAALAAEGRQLVVADAIDDDDLRLLADAADGFPLLTGGSGLAVGLPKMLGAQGNAAAWRPRPGPGLALAGSCSRTTLAQIAAHEDANGAARRISPAAVLAGRETPERVLEWALAQPGLPLVYSSGDAETVRDAQETFGREETAAALEAFFGDLARRAVAAGIRRLIVAGGETSGAVIQALSIDALELGPEIDPGVPALNAPALDIALTLKSGNFGSEDFFNKANRILAGQ